VIWVGLLVYAGYFFGNVPVVKENFSIAILAIIAISILPAAIEIMRMRMARSGSAVK
jgi:membrane-associated protein